MLTDDDQLKKAERILAAHYGLRPDALDLKHKQSLKDALERGETPLVHKGFSAEVTKSEDETRTVSFVISTADVDRHGDTVAVEGWQLAEYRKNPVVLWAHDSSQPIGSARNVRVEDGVLKADAVFSATSPKAIEIYNLVAEGHLKAVSVGFKILDYKINEERAGYMPMDITRAELWEFSVVSIPANPNALVETRDAAKTKTKGIAPGHVRITGGAEGHSIRVFVGEEEMKQVTSISIQATSAGFTTALIETIVDDIELEAKAGRVLSQKNYTKLTEARDAISDVLEAAEPTEDKQGGAAVIKLID